MINTFTTLVEKGNRAVLYLDEAHAVIRTNRFAREMLERQRAIFISNAKLATNDSDTNELLNDALTGAVTERESKVLFFAQENAIRPGRIDIIPVLDADILIENRKAAALAVVEVSSPQPVFIKSEIKRLYLLTNAEVKLAQSVFKGITIQEHARSTDTQVSTARWTLGNLFSKTNTSSQRELRELTLIFTP